MRLFRHFFDATFLISTTPAFASKSARKVSAGIALYNQLRFDAAFPSLEKEAQSGNVESQYYLGEALRKRNRYMAPEAQHWYETTAMNGSIYAMIQLGRAKNDLCAIMENCPTSKKTQAEWFAAAKKITLPKANDGTSAMGKLSGDQTTYFAAATEHYPPHSSRRKQTRHQPLHEFAKPPEEIRPLPDSRRSARLTIA